MGDLELANMLAAYHRECDEAEELADKGRVQLKHARLIREAVVKSCSIPIVAQRVQNIAAYFSKKTPTPTSWSNDILDYILNRSEHEA